MEKEILKIVKETQFDLLEELSYRLINMYYFIGNKLSNNYSLTKIEKALKKQYGNTVNFSYRNLKNMKLFYEKVSKVDEYKKIPWNLIVILINNKFDDKSLKNLKKYIGNYDMNKYLLKEFIEISE